MQGLIKQGRGTYALSQAHIILIKALAVKAVR